MPSMVPPLPWKALLAGPETQLPAYGALPTRLLRPPASLAAWLPTPLFSSLPPLFSSPPPPLFFRLLLPRFPLRLCLRFLLLLHLFQLRKFHCLHFRPHLFRFRSLSLSFNR